MGVRIGGRLIITDAEVQNCVFWNDGDAVLREGSLSSGVKSLSGTDFFDVDIRNDAQIVATVWTQPGDPTHDYPGPDFRRYKKTSGCALRFLFIRIVNGKVYGVKQYGRTIPNNKNLFRIIQGLNLIPTDDGDHLFIFSFYAWHKKMFDEMPAVTVPSDNSYKIYHRKLQN